VDAHAAPLCLHEQLGVEEPLVVRHVGEKLAGGFGTQRLPHWASEKRVRNAAWISRL
jgi:hypothetical protein